MVVLHVKIVDHSYVASVGRATLATASLGTQYSLLLLAASTLLSRSCSGVIYRLVGVYMFNWTLGGATEFTPGLVPPSSGDSLTI